MVESVGHNKQTEGVKVLHMHINAFIHDRVRQTAKREGRTIRNLVEHALLDFIEDAEASEDRAKLIRIMRLGDGR